MDYLEVVHVFIRRQHTINLCQHSEYTDDLFAVPQPEEATRVMNVLDQSMAAGAEVHFVRLLSLDILNGSCAAS